LLALQGRTHPALTNSIGVGHGMWKRNQFRVWRDSKKRLQKPPLAGAGLALPASPSPAPWS